MHHSPDFTVNDFKPGDRVTLIPYKGCHRNRYRFGKVTSVGEAHVYVRYHNEGETSVATDPRDLVHRISGSNE